MHVLQWIAVKPEGQLENPEQEVMQLVESRLQDEMGGQDQYLSWYDWFVIGGGRFVEGNPYESSPNHIISYAKDKDKFDKTIVDIMVSRVDEFNAYRKQFESKGIDLDNKLDSYTGEMRYDFELYPLKKMIDMIQGEWDFNSYFFDIHHDSTNVNHMQEDLDKEPENWYLVPVDFHF
jgi:hypothetical protein